MTNNYRVLVVDDEEDAREAIRGDLEELPPVGRMECDLSSGVRDATRKILAKYYDLVIVDLELGRNERGALDLYAHLAERPPGCELILMTQIGIDSGMAELVKLFGERNKPRFVGFIDKREDFTQQIRREIGSRYEAFTQSSVDFVNLELPIRLLEHRRGRYERQNTFPLRASGAELSVELDRLLRKLYVELPAPSRRRLSGVRVQLDKVDRRGLSAAIVLNATVHVNSEGDVEIPGHKTVLKVGPLLEIVEESSRYNEFVRFGMELDQRVELLGVATADTLGALVYSFAGGLHRQDLTSLDEILRLEFLGTQADLSAQVIRDLFQAKRWWSIEAKPERVSDYFKDNYRCDLNRSVSTAAAELRELPSSLGRAVTADSGGDGQILRIPGAPPLTIPGGRALGAGTQLRRVPTCLVHGDLHGGNVLFESEQGQSPGESVKLDRVCLIDYRNAGFGPRCVDAVALESSIRLADSEAVCRAINDAGEAALTSRQRVAVARDMAERFAAELQVYRWSFDGTGEAPTQVWATIAVETLGGLRKCFPDLTLKEYLATAIPYAIRNLGYDVLPVARVRVSAWLSALYDLSRSDTGGQGRKAVPA